MRFVEVKDGESLDEVVERLLPKRPPAEQKRLKDSLLDANPQIARKAKRLDASVLVIPEAAGTSRPHTATTPGASVGAFLKHMRGQVGDLQRPLDELFEKAQAELDDQRKLAGSAEVKAAARKEPRLTQVLGAITKNAQAEAAELKATRELLNKGLDEFEQDLADLLKGL